jgi:tRNA C32,U32 (ribose-2'-O)-methylase TrmJ
MRVLLAVLLLGMLARFSSSFRLSASCHTLRAHHRLLCSASTNTDATKSSPTVLRKADAVRQAHELRVGAPAVVLVRTQLAENVGSVARAMLNFGLTDLRLVDPSCDHLSVAAVRRASGAAPVLQQARVFPTVAAAVEDLVTVYAATARDRDMVSNRYTLKLCADLQLLSSLADTVCLACCDCMQLQTCAVMTPREACDSIVRLADSSSSSSSSSSTSGCTGVLFGPENSGLSNQDLVHSRAVMQIPTLPAFSSLNLAQAVSIFAYEWWQASATAATATSDSSKMLAELRTTTIDATDTATDAPSSGALTTATVNAHKSTASSSSSNVNVRKGEQLASSGELNNLMARLTAALDAVEFQSVQPARDSVYQQLHTALQRATLSKREVGLLHGVVTALSQGPKSGRKRR